MRSNLRGRLENLQLETIAAVSYCFWAMAVIVSGPRTFRTNDDVAMQAIASGDFTGTPDARWIFSGPLTAWPITNLYKVADFPWYGLAQYAMQILAGAAITTVLVRRRKVSGSLITWISIAILVVLQHRMLVLLSFTGTAFITGIAAVAVWLDCCRETDRRRRLAGAAVASAFFICAASTRSEVLPALGVISLPALLLSWRHGMRWLTLLGLTPIVTIFLNNLLVRSFTAPAYQDYLEYNALRGSLHGTARVSSETLTSNILSEVGWSTVDRALFALFIFDDWELFGYDKLLKVADATSTSRASFTFDLFANRVLFVYPGVFVGICIIAAVCLAQRRWHLAATQLATVGFASIAMTYILLTARLPERVTLPMWLGVVVITAASAGFGGSSSGDEFPDRIQPLSESRNLLIGLAALLAIAFVDIVSPIQGEIALPLWLYISVTAGAVILGSEHERLPWSPQISFQAVIVGFVVIQLLVRGPIGLGPTRAWAETTSEWYDDQVAFLESRPPGTTVVAGGASLRSEGMDPLGPGTFFDGTDYISMGWWVFSPMYESRKTLLSSPANMGSIGTNESVLWFGSSRDAAYLGSYATRGLPPAEPPLGLVSIGCAPLQPATCLWRLGELETEESGS